MNTTQFGVIFFLIVTLFSPYIEADEPELDENGNPIVKLEEAPNWSVVLEGQGLSSDDFAGKPYVLHFWSSWSPYSTNFQPGLHSIAQQYIDDGIETLAVSFWENARTDPIKVLNDRGYQFKPVPKGDDLAKTFSVQLPPTTIFINGKNEIVQRLVTHDPNDPSIRAAYEELKDSIQ